jgi:hypothetical protein
LTSPTEGAELSTEEVFMLGSCLCGAVRYEVTGFVHDAPLPLLDVPPAHGAAY